MKRKILFLIIGCIVTVAALAPIQGYFIYNTYKLYAKEANSEITHQLLKLETTGKLDTINAVWMRKTEQFIQDYADGKVARADYPKVMEGMADSLSGQVQQCIANEPALDNYDVTYTNYVTSASVCRDTTQPADTIYNGKMLLYGTNPENEPETQASQSTWRDTSNDRDTGEEANFEVVTTRYYSIANWEKEVFRRMSGLLIFSMLLLSFVVALFYLSIKNLITQKKIADIKTDFINNITHEFQTPLAALDIAVKTLQRREGTLTPEQFGNSISIIGRQNIRMQKLFGQVTDASLTTDIDISNAHPINCTAITEMLDDFALSHPDTRITCNSSNEVIVMDKFHLGTVLANLLDNAVKYGATAITISLQKHQGRMNLTVADNGMGISQKEQKLVFEKFYRVQKGNIHTTKGLGLGLYYVRQIAEAYKGSVALESEEGNGATFIISIPQP